MIAWMTDTYSGIPNSLAYRWIAGVWARTSAPVSYTHLDVYKRQDKEVCSKHNKTLDEVGSWKRTEMQLRDEIGRAHV